MPLPSCPCSSSWTCPGPALQNQKQKVQILALNKLCDLGPVIGSLLVQFSWRHNSALPTYGALVGEIGMLKSGDERIKPHKDAGNF